MHIFPLPHFRIPKASPYLRHATCLDRPYCTPMKTILLSFGLLATVATQAQKHVYEDLLVLYVDEKYEKCM